MKTTYESLPMSASPVRIQKFHHHHSHYHIHWHEEIEILYFTKGNAVISCDLKELDINEKDIVFVNGNQLHSGDIRNHISDYYCIHINTEFFHNLIGSEYVIFKNIISDADCSALLDKIIDEAKFEDFGNIVSLKKDLYEFFSLLTDRHVLFVLGEEDYKKHFKRLDTFNSIVEYIDKHYGEDMSVSSLANLFFISPSYFAHMFKKKSGKSVIEYINEVRIGHAKSFLEKEDTSIGDIALKVGFGDINYFSRKFKSITGMTPTEYKNRFSDNFRS